MVETPRHAIALLVDIMNSSSFSSQTRIDTRRPPTRMTETENDASVDPSDSPAGDATRDWEPRSLLVSYASSNSGARALSSSSSRTATEHVRRARRMRASGLVRTEPEETRPFCGSLVESDAGRKLFRRHIECVGRQSRRRRRSQSTRAH